jgi:hypothetical protein
MPEQVTKLQLEEIVRRRLGNPSLVNIELKKEPVCGWGIYVLSKDPRAARAIQTPAQQLAEELRPQYIVNWPIDECIAHLLEIARRADPLSDDDERAVRAAIRNCEVAPQLRYGDDGRIDRALGGELVDNSTRQD